MNEVGSEVAETAANNYHKSLIAIELCGGETGIRTLDTLRYTRFPSVRLQPLGHLSALGATCMNLSHRARRTP